MLVKPAVRSSTARAASIRMADGANIDAMSLQFSSVNSRPCPSDRFVMCFLGTRRASVQLIVTAPDHSALDTMPLADGLARPLKKPPDCQRDGVRALPQKKPARLSREPGGAALIMLAALVPSCGISAC